MPTAMTAQQRNYELHNLNQALDLIDALIEIRSYCTLTKLTEHVGLNKNKVFRLLATLENRGIIKKNLRGEYHFGPTAFSTARKILSMESIIVNAYPVMQELASATSEAVYFAIVTEGSAMLIDMIDCCQPIKTTSFVGSLIKLDGSSSGAEGTVCIKDKVIIEIGGLNKEITTMASNILNSRKEVVGALVILAPTFRVPIEHIKYSLVETLGNAARQLSNTMGMSFASKSRTVSTYRLRQNITNTGMLDGGGHSNVHGSFQL